MNLASDIKFDILVPSPQLGQLHENAFETVSVSGLMAAVCLKELPADELRSYVAFREHVMASHNVVIADARARTRNPDETLQSKSSQA